MPTVHRYRQNLYSFRIQYLNGALVMLRTDLFLVAKEGDLFMQVRRARLLDNTEVFVILIYEVNKKNNSNFSQTCSLLASVSCSIFSFHCLMLSPATKEGARLPDCGSSGVLLSRIAEKRLHHRLVPETNDALPRHATNASLTSSQRGFCLFPVFSFKRRKLP